MVNIDVLWSTTPGMVTACLLVVGIVSALAYIFGAKHPIVGAIAILTLVIGTVCALGTFDIVDFSSITDFFETSESVEVTEPSV